MDEKLQSSDGKGSNTYWLSFCWVSFGYSVITFLFDTASKESNVLR